MSDDLNGFADFLYSFRDIDIAKVYRGLDQLPDPSPKLVDKLQANIAKFLSSRKIKISRQVISLVSRYVKSTQDEMTAEDEAAVLAVLQAIDLEDWSVLAGDVEGIIEQIMSDQSVAALLQVGIDVEARPEILKIVNERAVEYARYRSAELVGMKRDELGRLVTNPDAQWAITDSTRGMIQDDVAMAIENGWSIDKLSEVLQDNYAFSDSRAETIARTETNLAMKKGAVDGYKASGVVHKKMWLTSDDELVDDECHENEDQGPIDLDDEFVNGDMPHPNCLIGETLITPCGSIVAHSERIYSGDVLIINTASGKNITCTPNHPILTRSGFIAAKLLNKGSKIVCSAKWKSFLNDDGDNVVTRIHDVPKSLWCTSSMTTTEVPITAVNFHGDGANSKIAIIRTDSSLSAKSYSIFGKLISNVKFVIANAQALTLNGLSSFNFFFEGMFSTLSRYMGGHDLVVSGLLRHLRPFNSFSLALGTSNNAGLQKNSSDDGAGNAKRFSYSVLTDAGIVFPDDIISIDSKFFHGNVYNIETTTGYYIANGIVTHNCRCNILPVVEFEQTQTEDENEEE